MFERLNAFDITDEIRKYAITTQCSHFQKVLELLDRIQKIVKMYFAAPYYCLAKQEHDPNFLLINMLLAPYVIREPELTRPMEKMYTSFRDILKQHSSIIQSLLELCRQQTGQTVYPTREIFIDLSRWLKTLINKKDWDAELLKMYLNKNFTQSSIFNFTRGREEPEQCLYLRALELGGAVKMFDQDWLITLLYHDNHCHGLCQGLVQYYCNTVTKTRPFVHIFPDILRHIYVQQKQQSRMGGGVGIDGRSVENRYYRQRSSDGYIVHHMVDIKRDLEINRMIDQLIKDGHIYFIYYRLKRGLFYDVPKGCHASALVVDREYGVYRFFEPNYGDFIFTNKKSLIKFLKYYDRTIRDEEEDGCEFKYSIDRPNVFLKNVHFPVG